MANHVHALVLPQIPPSRCSSRWRGIAHTRPTACWAEWASRSGNGRQTIAGRVHTKHGARSWLRRTSRWPRLASARMPTWHARVRAPQVQRDLSVSAYEGMPCHPW